MTTPTSISIDTSQTRNKQIRLLKASLLVLAFIVGLGAITVTAAAKTFTDEAGGMAGYA